MQTQTADHNQASRFLLLAIPLALILAWNAHTRLSGGGFFYLLALGAVLASLFQGGFAVRFAIACALAVALTALTWLPVKAWYAIAGVDVNFLTPLSGFTFGVELTLMYTLWRRSKGTVCGPLLVSVCALIAVVHFELAGGDVLELAIACVLVGTGLGAAVIAIHRGAVSAGAAAVAVACLIATTVYINAQTNGWRYAGFWISWIV